MVTLATPDRATTRKSKRIGTTFPTPSTANYPGDPQSRRPEKRKEERAKANSADDGDGMNRSAGLMQQEGRRNLNEAHACSVRQNGQAEQPEAKVRMRVGGRFHARILMPIGPGDIGGKSGYRPPNGAIKLC